MKALVQNCKTYKFLTARGTWSKVFQQAKDFASSQDAIDHCRRNDLQDVQVLLKFPNDIYDIKIPLSQSCAD